MSSEIDAAYDRLRAIETELRAQELVPLNESDTRFQILDRILIEVLGWSRDAIKTEKSSADGYIDYCLMQGARPALVIEAKRNGAIKLPTASQKTSALSLSGPVLKPFDAAVRQALTYASWQSVPLACVTDGNSWLFFQTNRRDGKPAIEGRGWLFPSFQAMKAEFAKFYDLLGPEGAIEKRGLLQLNRAEGIRPEQAEEQFIPAPPEAATMQPRSSLANDAFLLFGQFFSQLSSADDAEMLRHCFVETSESRKADLELEKITQKLVSGIVSLETVRGSALQAQVERTLNTMRSETVLIIGNKGSGKSTFVDRFFKEILPLATRERCVVASVNLAKFSGDSETLIAWATKELIDHIEPAVCSNSPPSYDDLRGIFWSEYGRWKAGSYKHLYDSDPLAFKVRFGEYMEKFRSESPDRYLKFLLDRASSGLQRLPCLTFDNADQFSSVIQDAIFQFAHSLGAQTPALSVVPITDRTVWRLSKAGALQSYPSRSFYLPVPQAKEILAKRVSFIKTKLSAGEGFAKQYFSERGFTISLVNLDRFAQAVEKLFVEREFISGLIGRLANFDIRRMLGLAERVFVSPELRIDEVLLSSFGIHRANDPKIHRSLIRGEYDRFSEIENPFVTNLFWTNPKDPSSPLLAFYILWVLRQRLANSRGDTVEDKYWVVSDLVAFLEACGPTAEQTLAVIHRLHERGLVESLDPTVEKVAVSHKIAIKESGIAHIEMVVSSPTYLAEMAAVTGINERLVYEHLKAARQSKNETRIEEERKIFIDYLTGLDKRRITLQSAQEYAGLVEARRIIRELGTVKPVDANSSAMREPKASRPLVAWSRGKGRPG